MSLAVTLWLPDWATGLRAQYLQGYFNKKTALGRLATKAVPYRVNPQSFYQRASYLFHQPTTLPIAATQACASLSEFDADAFWLCVAPVQMLADRDTLVMVPPQDLVVGEDEARLLFEAFNQHFAQDGVRLEWGGATSWYLRLPQKVDVQTTILDKASYCSLQGLFPQGYASAYWRKLMNEAQMLFYSLPLNQQRRLQGLAEINSIWIWGEGQLDRQQITLRPQAQIWSNASYLKGIAQLTEASYSAAPINYQAWLTQRNPSHSAHLIQLPVSRMETEALSDIEADFAKWEADWFSGLLEGLSSGFITSLYLDIGLKQNFLLTPQDLKRFWRWRNPLYSR